uniref:Uncharacterized protein n=1 Tax=Yersinia enterocolitica W22703 TaxID=913028 RepID=F4MUA6_YEREN|nr:hypothetical protein YEW_KB43800 [Yersinia enterocolitica W22703]
MTSDVAAKSLNARKPFSAEGLEELNTLHARLVTNLDLGMSVFLSRDINNAKRLRRAKHRFRLLNRRYSHAHVERLHQQNVLSIETSSLHMGLLGGYEALELTILFNGISCIGSAGRSIGLNNKLGGVKNAPQIYLR